MSKEILKTVIADEIEGKGNELSKLLEKYMAIFLGQKDF